MDYTEIETKMRKKMALSEINKREYSEEEIDILRGVIDYADRMIYEDITLNPLGGFADTGGYVSHSNASLYKQLRRSAYAKTVVIDTELKGRLKFRLSSTEAVYPNQASGYCTPHSPVGRVATIFQPGYKGCSKQWGDYHIVEVRSFDRYGGPEFEPNVRNFLHMVIVGDDGKDRVTDLCAFIGKEKPAKSSASDETEQNQTVQPISQVVQLGHVVELPPANVKIANLIVVEDADDPHKGLEIDGDGDWIPDDPPVKQEEYYGLSERFFTHQTVEQNQIIARSPMGVMFVEGIAGSGKTSAALGRTKMLTTFNAASVSDEQQFREVVGQDQDYWSADFAGQFSQESSVGFVRTGELIQYLQETCRRIDLPNLPILEYKELQAKLRDHRNLTSSSIHGRRWKGFTEERIAHLASTMEWLHAADQTIAKQIGIQLIAGLPKASELADLFDPEVPAMVVRVFEVALEHMQSGLHEISIELTQPLRPGAFALDRLAKRLLDKVEDVRRRVMGGTVIWTRVNNQTLYSSDENTLARKLIEVNAALYSASGQRLVFLDENGPIDTSLELLTTDGEPLIWSDNTRTLMAAGKVVSREASGENVYAMAFDVNQLFLRLLPESTEFIFVLVDGKLRRLKKELGWGRAKLPLMPVDNGKVEEYQTEDEAELSSAAQAPGQPRKSTPDAEFLRVMRRKLLQPLVNVADQYLVALQESANTFPDPDLAKRLHTQLGEFKLATEDIDLLLCLSHLMGRSLKKGGLKQLQEPTFYQAVFVDEVQDFTEQQVFLMVEQANPKYRAVTVVGDIAQKLHHGSTIDLTACFPSQSVPHVRLTENLRQADVPGLALFSASFREIFQDGDPPSTNLVERARQQGDRLVRPLIEVCGTNEVMDAQIVEALILANRHQTVAVLFPNSQAAVKAYERLEVKLRENMVEAEFSGNVNLARRHVRHFADVSNSKGLEFDVVLLADVDHYDLNNGSQINRLYVGITRARQTLVLLSAAKALPPQLAQLHSVYQNLACNP